jgi:hypothetical protein
LHASLNQSRVDVAIDVDPDTEGYSGLEATGLERRLRDRRIDEVTICDLASDYCVENMALVEDIYMQLTEVEAMAGVDGARVRK